MREIVFDTETTGMSPLKGDRVVEIGCVELHNLLATGRTFHAYLNPERDMPDAAAAVHGLTTEFLADKPVFASIVDQFLEFIGDAPLVAHNAMFDHGFINAELVRCGFPSIPTSRMVDTVMMARKKFPGAPASLDALCKRFNVDATARTLHGALLDAQLLAEVYLELKGGRQPDLAISRDATAEEIAIQQTRTYRAPRPHAPTEDEQKAHEVFMMQIKNALWRKTG